MKKLLALVLVVVVAGLAKALYQRGAAPGAHGPEGSAAARDLLTYIPADAPFAIASLQPAPKAVVEQTMAASAGIVEAYRQGFLDVRKKIAAQDGDNPETQRALAMFDALEQEFAGKTPQQIAEHLGLSLQSRSAFYGLGLLPVLRIQLGDMEKMRGFVERMQALAGSELVERPVGDGIELRDALRDETVVVHAGLVLNASGVAVDAVRRRLGIDGPQLIRRSRGSHLVLDPLGSEVGLAAFLPDRRIQFVIPHPDGTLSGTTEVDEPADGEDEPPVPEADVTYLLDALRYLYAVPPQRAELRHAYCGLRALPAVTGPAGRLNREAFLVAEDSAVGTVHSVVGGKLTTHRAFAERVVSRLFDIRAASPSRDLPLPGGEGSQEFGDPLWWRHGSRAAAVRALAAGDPSLLEPMCPHRELLRAALQRAAILSNEKYRGVKLEISKGEMRIVAHNPEQEEAVEEIEADTSVDGLAVGFNVTYLLDGLSALRGETVRIGLRDANSSALLREADSDQCQHVVMPLRL